MTRAKNEWGFNVKPLCIAALLSCLPTFSATAAELAFFGLDSVTMIGESEGHQIRGEGVVSSRTSGSAGVSATVLDPDTGSIWNFSVTQFTESKDSKIPGLNHRPGSSYSTVLSEMVVGLGDTRVTLGDFNFTISGAQARAAARTNGGLAPLYLLSN